MNMKMWLSTVLGSLFVFLIIKMIWNEVNSSLLLILLMIGYFIDFLILIHLQKKKKR